MSFRVDRVNSEVMKSLSNIIRNKLKDPRITEMISIMNVDVAKDLKTAKIYISIYGNKDNVQSNFEALKKCAGFIKHELSIEQKYLRIVPDLNFILDDSLEYSQKMNKIISELTKDKQ